MLWKYKIGILTISNIYYSCAFAEIVNGSPVVRHDPKYRACVVVKLAGKISLKTGHKVFHFSSRKSSKFCIILARKLHLSHGFGVYMKVNMCIMPRAFKLRQKRADIWWKRPSFGDVLICNVHLSWSVQWPFVAISCFCSVSGGDIWPKRLIMV